MTPSTSTIVLLAASLAASLPASFSALAAESAAPAPAPAPTPAPAPAPAAPPAPAKPKDYMDPVKHVKLNDDGSVWVGFGGETRARYEYWNNFNTGGAEGDFLLTRVLLSADLHLGPYVRLFAEGKSAFSTDRDELPGGRRTLDVDELDLQQGYAEFTTPDMDGLVASIKAGRLGLNFGKQRLVSTLPWANTMRSWDGADLTLKYKGWQVDAFCTEFVPVKKYDFNTADGQTEFWGAYATGPLSGELLKADAYYLGLDLRDSATWNGTSGAETRHTVGGRLFGKDKASGFDYDVEAAYQFGEVGIQDISAWMLGSELGWSAGDAMKTRLFGGLDYATGDKNPGGAVGTFRQLFPLGHAYYGQADVLGRQNAVDIFVGVSVNPVAALTVTASYHHFLRDSNRDAIYGVGGTVGTAAGALTSSDRIGDEIDLKATWKVDAHLALEVGYSRFFAGSAYDTGSPAIGNDIDFAYAQALFKF